MMLFFWLMVNSIFLPDPKTQKEIAFISNVKVNQDYTYQGAIGVYITYEMSTKALRDAIKNDSLFKKTKILLSASITSGNKPIQTHPGYDIVTNQRGFLEVHNTHSDMPFLNTERSNSFLFIPYAAMRLKTGKHPLELAINIEATGPYPLTYCQALTLRPFTIQKPSVYQVTVDIEFIEVNKLNAKNKVWDFGLASKIPPDITTRIFVANTWVWGDHIDNTYYYTRGPRSKNIKFYISKNDEARLHIEDRDLVIHDFIGEQIIPFKIRDLNQTLHLEPKFDSVIDSDVSYKIEAVPAMD